MCAAPCTLFWPRSGFTPVPGLPTLPVRSARFTSAITPSVPCTCSVIPRPWKLMDGVSRAYRRAACRTRSGSTPQVPATSSGRKRPTKARKASHPSTRSRRNAASTSPSSTRTHARAFSNTTLAPGRTARCSAPGTRASSMLRGSITMRFAPPSACCLMRAPTTGWPSVALAPQSRMVRARSMSSKELVAAPVPSIAESARAEGAWQTRAQLSTLLVPSTTRANFWAT